MGIGYLGILECLVGNQPIEYHIVENLETCDIAEDLFRDHSQLQFHRAVPTELREVNVVYLSTSLQYVEDYPALLRDLASLRPKFFLFASLQAGQNSTFVSAQLNFEDGSVVPCWFFNLDEIIQIMESVGYELSHKSTTDRRYEMSNFDERHRVSRYCNLLFIDNLYLKQHENDTK